MRQYKTQGIIIKRSNFSEADRLFSIYTRDYGKISAIAHGVRKTKSKLAGHLELFYLTDFQIHKGKNIDTVTGANLITRYDNLRNNKELINHTYYISELIYRSTHENLASREIFELTKNIFSVLNLENKEKMACYFELKLFDILGHRPEVKKCVICLKEVSEEKNYFDYQSGGLVCGKCLKHKDKAIKIDSNLIKLLRIIEKQNQAYFTKIKTNPKMIDCLRICISQIRHAVLENELKSSKYL